MSGRALMSGRPLMSGRALNTINIVYFRYRKAIRIGLWRYGYGYGVVSVPVSIPVHHTPGTPLPPPAVLIHAGRLHPAPVTVIGLGIRALEHVTGAYAIISINQA